MTEVERRFLHVLFSPVTGYVEHRRLMGWSGFLPFYKTRCPVHGEYVTYPQGYSQRLPCPRCQLEARQITEEVKNE